MSKPIASVEEFVEQCAFFEYTVEHLHYVEDRISMFGKMYDMLGMKNLKVSKEDLESFKDSRRAIKGLHQILENVEN